MDKKLIDTLINNGYITTHVNPDAFKDVDDLFDKGIITFPGSKNAVVELLEKLGIKSESIIEPVGTLNVKDDNNNTEIKKDIETTTEPETTTEHETTTEPVAEAEEVSVKKSTKKTTKKTE